MSMGIYIFREESTHGVPSPFFAKKRAMATTSVTISSPGSSDPGCTYAYDFQKNAQNSTRYWRDIGTLDAYYEASMDLVDSAGFLSPRKGRITPHSMYADGSGGIKRSVLSPDIELADDVPYRRLGSHAGCTNRQRRKGCIGRLSMRACKFPPTLTLGSTWIKTASITRLPLRASSLSAALFI